MAQQTFGNLELRSAVRAKLNANATEAESRLAALESAGGGSWPATDSTLQSANFSFGAASRIAVVSVASGNIVGTLPAAPVDGQICGVVCQGIAGGSSNRFTLGLNGKTLDGAGQAVETTSALPATPSPGTLAQTFLQLGATQTNNIVSYETSGYGPGPYLNFGSSLSWLQIVATFANSGYFQFRARVGVGASSNPLTSANILLNGVATSPTVNGSVFVDSFSGWWMQSYRVNVPNNQASTLRITSSNFITIDQIVLVNKVGTAPSAWTDVTARNVGPSGVLLVQYSVASQTWHVIYRRQLA